MKKFLVWLICLILLTQPVFAQSEKLIILNTNTGQNTDADTGQNVGAGEQNSSDTTENTDNVNTQQTGNVDISAPSALLMEASTGQVIYEKDADSKRPPARRRSPHARSSSTHCANPAILTANRLRPSV